MVEESYIVLDVDQDLEDLEEPFDEVPDFVAGDIDLSKARVIFPRFNRLSDQELTELFSKSIFGPNVHLQKAFPDAHLFKNNEGQIAGMESTEGGEKLFFDAPIEGKLEFVANRVLVAM